MDCRHQEVLVELGAILLVHHAVDHLQDLELSVSGKNWQRQMVERMVQVDVGVQEAQLHAVAMD